MPAALPIPEHRLAELAEFRRGGCRGFDLRRFLCVWLRAERRMSAAEIAMVLGMNANSVRIVQRRFIAEGASVFKGAPKGPKGPFLMSFAEEARFLEKYRDAAVDGSMLTAADIKAAWEGALGRRVHKTTLYRMLKRHGWRKVVPRPRHPKQDPGAVDAFKKGATREG